ncbi:hypothetical protein GCM10010112_79310 [Actinoplanes lobatus]|uniref:Uncharacterized protein n=1 Tax=Actinoplanes lobatus TaxID=113568 RepID=A0A7W7HIN5_9ACTN|nr:hypothetical protein [Actinoplanes lobatus]MBB4750862.1 hypothetical protein [Actinoplanes lobatus]GGN92293.1 hypothetical protein GCM10010112_79310 [Actinoplanes lobatus]GIE44416.1 hypothetical protein Alo02nite_73140 [Actinoplanes lobatus]
MTAFPDEAVVPFDCGTCPPGATATFSETIAYGRLCWSRLHSCTDGPVLECGWDEPPPELRQVLLDQCGVFRLRLSGITSRVTVMKVLRERGAALSDIAAMLTTLTGQGVTGTEMELRLLSMRLDGTGVITLSRECV